MTKKLVSLEKRQSVQDVGSGELLKAIGERMIPGGTEYVGSAAVHIYADKFKKEVVFLTQAPLGGLNEVYASEAIKELAKKCMLYYGRKPPTNVDEQADPNVSWENKR